MAVESSTCSNCKRHSSTRRHTLFPPHRTLPSFLPSFAVGYGHSRSVTPTVFEQDTFEATHPHWAQHGRFCVRCATRCSAMQCNAMQCIVQSAQCYLGMAYNVWGTAFSCVQRTNVHVRRESVRQFPTSKLSVQLATYSVHTASNDGLHRHFAAVVKW